MSERRTWRYNVEFSFNEKDLLQRYFKAELNLYNELNQRLSTQVRQISTGFTELSRNLRVFGEVFEHNINLRSILKEGTEFPKQLHVVRDDITILSDKALTILDNALIKTSVSPRTKRNMGVQMFRFYAEQARSFAGGAGVRTAPVVLENYDIHRKRHVQLHRKSLIVEYDQENNKTLITIPYFKRKLVIEDNAKRLHWDVLIIHQEPNIIVSNNTPWYVDLKKTNEDYILKYLDNSNPNRNSSFSQIRNDYRRTSFR